MFLFITHTITTARLRYDFGLHCIFDSFTLYSKKPEPDPTCNSDISTVELQCLKHRWLVYHGYFELVIDSLTKNPIAADIVFGII